MATEANGRPSVKGYAMSHGSTMHGNSASSSHTFLLHHADPLNAVCVYVIHAGHYCARMLHRRSSHSPSSWTKKPVGGALDDVNFGICQVDVLFSAVHKREALQTTRIVTVDHDSKKNFATALLRQNQGCTAYCRQAY